MAFDDVAGMHLFKCVCVCVCMYAGGTSACRHRPPPRPETDLSNGSTYCQPNAVPAFPGAAPPAPRCHLFHASAVPCFPLPFLLAPLPPSRVAVVVLRRRLIPSPRSCAALPVRRRCLGLPSLRHARLWTGSYKVKGRSHTVEKRKAFGLCSACARMCCMQAVAC